MLLFEDVTSGWLWLREIGLVLGLVLLSASGPFVYLFAWAAGRSELRSVTCAAVTVAILLSIGVAVMIGLAVAGVSARETFAAAFSWPAVLTSLVALDLARARFRGEWRRAS